VMRLATARRYGNGAGSCAMPCTSSPRSTRRSARWLPAKPVIPVMSTRRGIGGIVPIRSCDVGDRTAVALAYAAIALSWGGTWVVAKAAVLTVPPLELSAIRFLIVAALLLLACAVLRIPLGTRHLGAVVVAGLVGITGYNALVFVALTVAPASDGALIVPTTVPILTAVAALSIGERLTREKAVGAAIASVGAALVILGAQGFGGTLSAERLVADLMTLAGAACWAVYGVAGRVAMRDRSPTAQVALTSLVGALGLLPLGFLERGYTDVPSWPLSAWLGVAYLVAFGTIVGFVLFYWAVRRFGAGIGAMSSYMVPVAAVTLAFVFLGERPHPAQLVGAAVILAGVRIATLGARRTAEVSEAAA
jgi:drug/metabolite transporter (DMT)-like permease